MSAAVILVKTTLHVRKLMAVIDVTVDQAGKDCIVTVNMLIYLQFSSLCVYSNIYFHSHIFGGLNERV